MKKKILLTQQQQGSVLIAVSALFYATYGVWSKLMADTFGEFNQAWIRALLLLCFVIPFGILTKAFRPVRKQDWKWFLVISLAGGLNQAPYFYGFEHLPVGTATLLFYIMLTLGAFVIGKFFFQEKITPLKYLSLGIGGLGLFLLYRFSLEPNQLFPALLTSLAGIMGAGIVVFSKKLSSLYSEIQILTSAFTAMLVGNLIFSIVFSEPLPGTEFLPWTALILYAISMLIANAAVVAGFRHLEPSIGGLIGLLEVLFAVLFGVLVFQEELTPQILIGSVCILVAAGLPYMITQWQKQKLKV